MTLDEHYRIMINRAKKEGLQEGEGRINKLNLRLRDEGRVDDIFKAAEDAAYREQLFKEFQL